jgi:hypothetical protein
VSHSGAARKHRAGAISAVLVCLKSAEPFYEPSVLRPLGQTTGAVSSFGHSGAGRALRYAGAPRPPAAQPQPPKSDVSKWQKE